MTLVASSVIDNYPLLIGDILLSAPETKSKLYLPTVGEITNIFPEGSGFFPSGTKQKIAIIDQNLIIGWAGNVSAARTVIKEMIKINQKEPFTPKSLGKYFETIDNTIWNQGVNFVGFIRESTTNTRFLHFGCDEYWEFNSEQYGLLKMLGSGVEHLVNLLSTLDYPVPFPSGLNKLEHVLFKGVGIIGCSLGLEVTTKESLLNFYGGGYEIASLFNRKFQKLDDVTHIFWFAEISAESFKATINQVCKYSYVEDVLLIRSATLSQISDKNGQSIEEESVFIIPPIYRDVKDEEIKSFVTPSFNSKFICNYFITFNPSNNEVKVHSCTYYSGSDNSPFNSNDNNKSLKISFEKVWLDRIINTFLNYSKK